jgi:hypothetical protein
MQPRARIYVAFGRHVFRMRTAAVFLVLVLAIVDRREHVTAAVLAKIAALFGGTLPAELLAIHRRAAVANAALWGLHVLRAHSEVRSVGWERVHGLRSVQPTQSTPPTAAKQQSVAQSQMKVAVRMVMCRSE